MDTRLRILEAARALVEQEGAAVSMGRIAEHTGVSRRAVYLHFASKAELLLALVAFVDEMGSLSERAAAVWDESDGTRALEEFVALNAFYNGEIHAIARAVERVRETDAAAAAAWSDRMEGRQAACLALARRLSEEGSLSARWTPDAAADLIWAFTNMGVWRDLVLDRGWPVETFRDHVAAVLRTALLGE